VVARTDLPGNTRLRLDSWEPEYGASAVLEEVAETALPPTDLAVEGAWEPRSPAATASVDGVAFVDGVRRIEARLFAERDEGVAPALAGAWAVGVVRLGDPAEIDPIVVTRTLVLGGGLTHPDLTVSVGGDSLTYHFASVAGSGPLDIVQGLQTQMREGEAELARRVFSGRPSLLLLLDGPLTYFAGFEPVVGVIKRQVRSYLPPESASILASLGPGQRTPVFMIGEQRLERYSWYTRIAPRREIDGILTGILRLEVATAVGLERARELADVTTGFLPRLASDRARDPRAPQNLYPVGRLEAVLRHRLGDAMLIRRAVETALWRARG
jgi:hypothetical protein